MAVEDSVTVSMGLDTRGVDSRMLRVKLEARLTSLTAKSMYPGIKIKSSYVYATPLVVVKMRSAEYPSGPSSKVVVRGPSYTGGAEGTDFFGLLGADFSASVVDIRLGLVWAGSR
jgi:hypothetical protein